MEATQLLERQHDLMLRLAFVGLTDPQASRRRALLAELADVTLAHMTSEDRLFIPAIRTEDLGRQLETHEAEHQQLRDSIAHLLDMDAGDPRFEPERRALAQLLERHAESEERELFIHVRAGFSADELEELGQELERLYRELRRPAPGVELPFEEELAAPA